MSDNVKPVILAVFEQLAKENGIIARPNWWCCNTCGSAAIEDQLEKMLPEDRAKYTGFVFWHEQDEELFHDKGLLYLSFGSAKKDCSNEETIAVGETIVNALRERCLQVIWPGNAESRILVLNVVGAGNRHRLENAR